jgi:hypothetical protein
MTTSRTPNVEHHFFAYDPEGEGLLYYSSAKERDDAVRTVMGEMQSLCEWDGVEFISVGEVTHIVDVSECKCELVQVAPGRAPIAWYYNDENDCLRLTEHIRDTIGATDITPLFKC